MASVRLRPAAAADRDRLLAWRNLPEVARWMYTDHAISPEEHARWYDGALEDPRRAYWIIEADGAPAGLANLYDIDPRNGRAAWAYYLAAPGARGKGAGAYVEFLMLEHVFVELGLNKLWCEVLVDNEPVWRLHQSFGFVREALFRQHVRKLGEYVDVAGYGLLREEWLRRRDDSCARLQAKGYPAELAALR